jgi:hypothetical protein
MLWSTLWSARELFGAMPQTADDWQSIRNGFISMALAMFSTVGVLLYQLRRCLRPYLDEVVVGTDGTQKVLWLVVNITNSGNQTLAQKWRAELHRRGEPRLSLTARFFSGEISLVTPDYRRVQTKGEPSLSKRALVPIAEGGNCRGILMFPVNEWPEIGDKIVLRFSDAYLRNYKMTEVLSPSKFRTDSYGDCEVVVTPLASDTAGPSLS